MDPPVGTIITSEATLDANPAIDAGRVMRAELNKTPDEFGVPGAEQNELYAIVESAEADIVVTKWVAAPAGQPTGRPMRSISSS